MLCPEHFMPECPSAVVKINVTVKDWRQDEMAGALQWSSPVDYEPTQGTWQYTESQHGGSGIFQDLQLYTVPCRKHWGKTSDSRHSDSMWIDQMRKIFPYKITQFKFILLTPLLYAFPHHQNRAVKTLLTSFSDQAETHFSAKLQRWIIFQNAATVKS